MDYVDGLVLIGGTVYNRFPTNYANDKEIDHEYSELTLKYTPETTINKFP